jgi:hypothetical protein
MPGRWFLALKTRRGAKADQPVLRAWRVRSLLIYSLAMFFVLGVVTVSGHGGGTVLTDVQFISTSTDDRPGTLDPGYTKNVAVCTSRLVNSATVEVKVYNSYPSYTCTFTVTVKNTGKLTLKLNPLTILAPPVLTLTDLSNDAGITLGGGAQVTEKFSVHVEQPSKQEWAYTFLIKKPFRLYHKGTIGFWRAWNNHNTFTRTQIQTWLTQIDQASKWYGPRTAEGMVSLMNTALGGGATMKDKFLAHCLATRMNERSGILAGADTHNVMGVDPGNFLGLGAPQSATLNQIIAAIENKFGWTLTTARYETMKNVCDRLNNLDI